MRNRILKWSSLNPRWTDAVVANRASSTPDIPLPAGADTCVTR